jgi:DNA polymerase-3 subunit beta
MKFAVERDALLRAAAQCKSVVNAKSAQPILTTVHLTATGAGALELYATDLITTVQTRVPAAVEKPGAVCLPAHALVDALQALLPGEVTAQVGPSHAAVLKSGRRKTEIIGLAADDYPALVAPPTTWIELPAQAFRGMLATVAHAISGDEARPHMRVAYLRTVGKQLVATATDGHRVARATATLDEARPLEVSVPAPAVAAVLREPPAGETIGICVRPADVWFRLGETRVASKLVDGFFPAVDSLFAQRHDRRAKLPRSALLESVQALRKASAREGLLLSFGPTVLDMRIENVDRGQADTQLDVALDGTPGRVGVKAQYLADLLGALDSEQVDLQLGDELDQLLFHAASRGLEVAAIIAPMRI